MDPIIVVCRILRYLFYILVAATLVLFALDHYGSYTNPYWVYCGCGAIGCSVIRFFLKMSL